jgi:RNA polymerase sigma-70 factor (ECF subfamily)
VEASVQELVRQAKRGDAAAFTQLIGRFERTAMAVGYAACGNGDMAAEAVQEAFLRAWQRLPELRDADRFGAWLAQIVQRAAMDQHRQARRQPHLELPAMQVDPRQPADPTVDMSRRELDDRVRAALGGLDDVSRTALVLRYYEDMSSRQIAELLEMSPAAVDMRLMRARQEMKRMLGAEPAQSGEVMYEPNG